MNNEKQYIGINGVMNSNIARTIIKLYHSNLKNHSQNFDLALNIPISPNELHFEKGLYLTKDIIDVIDTISNSAILTLNYMQKNQNFAMCNYIEWLLNCRREYRLGLIIDGIQLNYDKNMSFLEIHKLKNLLKSKKLIYRIDTEKIDSDYEFFLEIFSELKSNFNGFVIENYAKNNDENHIENKKTNKLINLIAKKNNINLTFSVNKSLNLENIIKKTKEICKKDFSIERTFNFDLKNNSNNESEIKLVENYIKSAFSALSSNEQYLIIQNNSNPKKQH